MTRVAHHAIFAAGIYTVVSIKDNQFPSLSLSGCVWVTDRGVRTRSALRAYHLVCDDNLTDNIDKDLFGTYPLYIVET